MFAPQQNQQQGGDFFSQVGAWWAGVPFGTKFLMVSTSILYLLDLFFNGFILYMLADIPAFTIAGQIWRILAAQFVHRGLLDLLFSLLSIYFSAKSLENTIGSVTFISDLMIKGILIQVLYLLIVLIFSFISPAVMMMPSFGLWNLVMVYISIRSFSNPDQETQFLCFPVMIKNLYYPIAILVFVTLLSFPMIRLDLAAAVLLGYIEYRLFNGMLFRPSKQRVDSWTGTFMFRSASQRPDFVPYDGRLNDGNNSGQFNARPVNDTSNGGNQSQNFKEFSGKGVKLGQGPQGGGNLVYPLANQYEAGQEGQDIQIVETTEEQQQQAQKKKNKNYNQLGEDLV